MSINVLAQSRLLSVSAQDLPLICPSSNGMEDSKVKNACGNTCYLAIQGQAADKYDKSCEVDNFKQRSTLGEYPGCCWWMSWQCDVMVFLSVKALL